MHRKLQSLRYRSLSWSTCPFNHLWPSLQSTYSSTNFMHGSLNPIEKCREDNLQPIQYFFFFCELVHFVKINWRYHITSTMAHETKQIFDIIATLDYKTDKLSIICKCRWFLKIFCTLNKIKNWRLFLLET